jgi:putative transposase
MSKKSNQEFVQIPHSTLIHMIRYKAERKGIRVIVHEESYTSKASFLDNDMIPVYDPEKHEEYRFSGRRISRGLYRSKNGTVISADVNGGANILRKADPEDM